MRTPVIFYLLFSVLFWSCKHDHTHHEGHEMEHDHGLMNEEAVVEADAQTVAMNNRVKAAFAKVDPMGIDYYFNREHVNDLREQVKNATVSNKRVELQFRYANELLNTGMTRDAIVETKLVIEQIEDLNIAANEAALDRARAFLALCYMRLGEQENCIINHTASSCIIPIMPEGQHQKREGSTKAIEIYEQLLKKYPNDYQSKYLLNVAYMTLGEYPDGVPSPYLIPGLEQSDPEISRFKNRATDLGIDVNELSGGVCMGDFNNDGLTDILASSWGSEDQIRLYLNRGDEGFEEVSAAAGLSGVSSGLNIQHADYNNDGHLDFFILRGAWFAEQGFIPNSLIRNNGDGTFTDVTLEAGVYSEYPTQTAAWADFDLDGWLDLFVGNESNPGLPSPSELWHNNGDGTFTNVSAEAGIGDLGFVKGVTAGDIDNDGRPEIYISRMRGANMLFYNESANGVLRFTDIGTQAGVTEPLRSFPTWFFDFNNDGYEDIFVSGYVPGDKQTAAALFAEALELNIAHPLRPRLYLNKGNRTFADASQYYGLGLPAFTMGCNYGDINNDGFPDFYLGTGEPNLNSIIPNLMYLNEGGKGTRNITFSSGLGHIQKGHGIGFSDLDMDGDQDIYAVMGGAFDGDLFQNAYFENPNIGGNNWVSVKLVGKTANRSAIGARIIAYITENGQQRKVYSKVSSGASFGGNDLRVHIGLGKAVNIDRLTIVWPNAEQTAQAFENVPVNRSYEITEGGVLNDVTKPPLNFARKEGGHEHNH